MKSLIDDGRIHVFDGAMGTELYGRGVFVNVCYDEITLSRPDLVGQIHREYVAAGAEILETNTFGANPVKLSAYGLSERTRELNVAAAKLARAATEGRASVAGAIGPLGIRIEPWGPTGRDEAAAHFGEQVAGLLEGGVDGFVLETFSDLSELECVYAAIRAASDLPVVAQMTVGQDGKTAYGTDPAHIAKALSDLGVDVIGLNCSVGPAVMLDAIEEMADVTDVPLSAQPNAGLPRTVRDRQIYMASPDYLAEYTRRLIDVGARFVGGCCGTTPDHIRRMREIVDGEGATRTASRSATLGRVVADDAPADAVALPERSAWGRRLSSGEPVVSVEIVPPHGWNAADVVEPARALQRSRAVDVVSIVDSPRSRNRMAALSAATLVEREVGIETLVHYACRGKTMGGMISDLLGAAAEGLRNILIVSGDPPPLGLYTRADAASAVDIDSIGLTNVVYGLNRGLDPGGGSIGEPTPFVHGVAVAQGALDRELELERFRYKLEAGADFAVTQPLFDVERLEPFLELAAAHGVPVVAGIWPFPNLRSAEFLANELPGADVPEGVVERMRSADRAGAETALSEGVSIALETIELARPLVQGFHISTPRKQVDVALRVLREAGLGR